MSISSIPPLAGAGQGAPAASPASGNNALGKLDYSAFLRLLVAQLKNQDPTKPMDSTQYMSQLASYANVEQNIRANDKLDQVLLAVQAAHADNLAGKTVTSAGGSISGKVTGYEIMNDGLVLILENGGRLPFDPGLTVQAP